MKKIIKVSLVALLLLSLTACSAVFDSAISGTVKDKNASSTSSTSTGGIADVMVYAYDNEEAWNNKYNSWDGKSEFKDHSVPSARTAQDGSFSISNLRWMTNSPVYGKDADSKTIYLLAFHKDYGLEKVEGRTIQSDKANNFGIIEMGKVTATKTLTISLKDIEDNTSTATGSDATISDTTGFSFKYTYADGYKTGSDGKFEDNVTGTISSFTNGKATIVVKYNEDNFSTTDENNVTTYSVPSVTIYDIQTGSDWELDEAKSNVKNGKKVIEYEGKEYKNTDLKFSNAWKTVTVNLSLIDGSSANLDSITDPIYFKWSYNNGEEEKNGNVTTTTGSASINVKYKKNMSEPTLTLSEFDDSDTDDDKWTWTMGETNAAKMSGNLPVNLKDEKNKDKDTITKKIYFRKNYITLPTSGISGHLITKDSINATGGIGNKDKDYGDTLILKWTEDSKNKESANTVDTWLEVVASTSTSEVINYGYFTGLASNQKIKITYNDSNPDDLTYKGNDVELTLAWKLRNALSYEDGNKATITVNSMTTASDLSNIMLYKN